MREQPSEGLKALLHKPYRASAQTSFWRARMVNNQDVGRLAKEHRIKPYIIKRFLEFLGHEETVKLLDAIEKPPPTCIRVNTLKSNSRLVKERLESQGFQLSGVPQCDYAFTMVKQPFPLSHTVEYLNGEFFIQTQASLYPPIVLDPQPKENVLDLAAAPGGKTSHLAQIMQNKGVITAIEVNRERISSLIHNLRRLNIENTIIIRSDTRMLKITDAKYDRILLDAPCSGEGLLAIDQERRTSRQLSDIRECSLLQSQLLDKAISLLKPGGTLVYSTCTFAPEENELQIDLALRRYQELELVSTNLTIGIPGLTQALSTQYLPDLSQTRRLYPHRDNTIGFFIAKIQHRI